MASTPITPTYSIVTSWFNVEKMKFDWRGALQNWLAFQKGNGQIVIAINTSVDNSPKIVREWISQWKAENPHSFTKIDVLDIEIPYTDPAFDGKGKAAATAAADQPSVILLDCDERLLPSMRGEWDLLAIELEMTVNEAFLIPVVDLFGDERSFKSVGTKWYLHKNLPHLTRGVVKYAWNSDGVSWRTDVSDSCELINKETNELARCSSIIMSVLPGWMLVAQMESGRVPFVYHLGWLEAEQRLRQSEFWAPVWEARSGGVKKEPKLTLEDLEKMQKFRHNLPTWREQT